MIAIGLRMRNRCLSNGAATRVILLEARTIDEIQWLEKKSLIPENIQWNICARLPAQFFDRFEGEGNLRMLGQGCFLLGRTRPSIKCSLEILKQSKVSAAFAKDCGI
jgi:hypothetical protein